MRTNSERTDDDGGSEKSGKYNSKIGILNVRSLNKLGKLENVANEMKRMGVGILGVAETFWRNDGDCPTELPDSVGGDKYKIFYSGGEKSRRGVGMIVSEVMLKSVMSCEPISERIIIMRLKMKPVNMLLVQVYAPCENDKEKKRNVFMRI